MSSSTNSRRHQISHVLVDAVSMLIQGESGVEPAGLALSRLNDLGHGIAQVAVEGRQNRTVVDSAVTEQALVLMSVLVVQLSTETGHSSDDVLVWLRERIDTLSAIES